MQKKVFCTWDHKLKAADLWEFRWVITYDDKRHQFVSVPPRINQFHTGEPTIFSSVLALSLNKLIHMKIENLTSEMSMIE